MPRRRFFVAERTRPLGIQMAPEMMRLPLGNGVEVDKVVGTHCVVIVTVFELNVHSARNGLSHFDGKNGERSFVRDK